jgi:hypothetical protein
MVTTKWSKVCAIVLVFALPAAIMSAETQGAMLYATNTVILNGSHVSRTSAVLPGDKVAVPSNSSVTISLKGTSILVPMNSSLVYKGNAVELEPQAAVSVNTKLGMAAEISGLKISPAKNGTASYEVARYNGQVFVAAKEGSVLIASATGTRTINEGTKASVPDPAPQTQAPAATGVSGIPTWVAELVGLVAVGAATGIGIAATRTPASPVTP